MTPLAVYVHIPFCTVKCGYCDFNAYSGLDGVKDAYGAALLTEIDFYRDLLAGREVASIHFGGGTPSEVPAAQIAAVVERIRGHATLAAGAEVGLEANPGTTTYEHLVELRTAGVTRLSLGAQSFHADELQFLDRIHSPEATAASLRNARTAGFESVSLDLIYGLPDQPLERWAKSLSEAVRLGPDHISCYGLTVEDGTPLARRVAAGAVTPTDGDASADMYELAMDTLEDAGYRHYELSNWARPGHESRHNRVYWRDGDYLGIGAGAHGYLAGERYENVAHPRAYVTAAARGEPVLTRYRLDSAITVSDWLALRLRLVDGFSEAEFEARFARSLDTAVGEPLAECAQLGLLERREGTVRLTRRGRSLHSEVAVRLLLHLERSHAEPRA